MKKQKDDRIMDKIKRTKYCSLRIKEISPLGIMEIKFSRNMNTDYSMEFILNQTNFLIEIEKEIGDERNLSLNWTLLNFE